MLLGLFVSSLYRLVEISGIHLHDVTVPCSMWQYHARCDSTMLSQCDLKVPCSQYLIQKQTWNSFVIKLLFAFLTVGAAGVQHVVTNAVAVM